MNFDSIEKILNQLAKQPGWSKFRDYQQLLKCWHSSVNQNTAQHTRPLYIARQVLWVATDSAARAQELSFQRYALLKRLNRQLPFTLKDIRFSSSGWHQKNYLLNSSEIFFKVSQQQSEPKASEPKIVTKSIQNNIDSSSPAEKAKLAAQSWLERVEQNSASWLSCPICNAPTSTREIDRWNSCYLCVSQKWSQEYRPPTFPESK